MEEHQRRPFASNPSKSVVCCFSDVFGCCRFCDKKWSEKTTLERSLSLLKVQRVLLGKPFVGSSHHLRFRYRYFFGASVTPAPPWAITASNLLPAVYLTLRFRFRLIYGFSSCHHLTVSYFECICLCRKADLLASHLFRLQASRLLHIGVGVKAGTYTCLIIVEGDYRELQKTKPMLNKLG